MAITTAADKMTHTLTPVEARLLAEFSANEDDNCADRNDQYRKNWLNGNIRSIQAALDAGVDVQGYLHWSMFDNFEWASGRWPCFGLVGIDYDNDLKRVPRKSAVYYAAIVKKARGL